MAYGNEKLSAIKKNIKSSHDYFDKNIKRYLEYYKFFFDTSLDSEDQNKLDLVQKPPLEFNIGEAYISRLCGEFAKHEPDIIARAADGVQIDEMDEVFLQQLEVMSAHLREIFFNINNDGLGNKLYKDILAGGFSVAQVKTDYIHELSFEQNIKIERVFDPTLTGFDPLARMSHKGDGQYCFLLYPKTKEEFEEEYGSGSSKDMKFVRSTEIGGFNWSYIMQNQEIILLAEYYEKKRTRQTIAKLSNGHVILKKHYKDLMEIWDRLGYIEQPPQIISERSSFIETIDQYIICENQILSHKETNFRYLPLVFLDGNSVVIRGNENMAASFMTRPFLYHAKGVQKLKNFAGQTIAAEIENMVMHKFTVPLEAIPEGYEAAYKNVQIASTLVYNQFYKDNPEVRLDPPREIQRTPTPPLVENTFMGLDRTSQIILGSYDSVLGTNDKQISGVAIQQGALQSNAAAIPYLEGYINGLNQLASIIVDLIPKYYVTPRSIPIRHKDGKRAYQIINAPKNPMSIDMLYNPNNFQIKVEAGISAGVQKQVALEQITRMMQSSQTFAEFINSMGLETIVDNLDIRGVEALKVQAAQFMKRQAELAEQQAQAGDPMLEAQREQTAAYREAELAKVEQQAMKTEGDLTIQAAKVANEKQLMDIKFMEAMAKIEEMGRRLDVEEERINAENARSAVETAINLAQSTMREQPIKGEE